MKSRQKGKAGVTIIEVLIAIGIVVIALMGIAGLVMISGAQLSEGLKADSMNNLALSAIQRIETQELNTPQDFLVYSNANNNFVPLPQFYGINRIDDNGDGTPDDNGEFDLWKYNAICIDPYFIATQVTVGSTIARNNVDPEIRNYIRQFPISGVVSMPRITVARPELTNPTRFQIYTSGGNFQPLNSVYNIVNDPSSYDPTLFGPNVGAITNLFHAQELFTSKDNLAYRQGQAKTELPQQLWIDYRPNLNSSIPMKRIGFGDKQRLGGTEISWMATIVPKVTSVNSLPNSGASSNQGRISEGFTMSIVVFQNRVLNYVSALPGLREQTFEVRFKSSGLTGGQIDLIGSNLPIAEIKNGDWLMLASTGRSGPHFRWYQVTYIDSDSQIFDATVTPNIYRKSATIRGTDWDVNPSRGQTYATWLPRVIGVYEKVFKWEGNSLY